MAPMTSAVKRGVLVAGCLLILAGCGTAAASAQHSGKPAHKSAVTVTTQLPTPIPDAGWSFAPYPAGNSAQLISADAALAAAKASGVNPQAWTEGSPPTATLVEFTNTFSGTAATPAWVIYVDNVPISRIGMPVVQSSAPSQVEHAEWIINAQTGAYIQAGNA